MDKNTLIGFVLIGLLTIGYMWYIAPSTEQIEATKRKQDSIELVKQRQIANQNNQNSQNNFNNTNGKDANQNNPQITNNVDTSSNNNTNQVNNQTANIGGFFTNHVSGSNQIQVLENDLVKLDISTEGGRISKAELKNFKTYEGEPLVLMDGPQNSFNYQFFINNLQVNTQNLFFTIENATATEVQLKASANANSHIIQTYTLKDGDYMVDYDIQFVGFDKILSRSVNDINLNWATELRRQEKVPYNESIVSSIFYQDSEEDVDYCSCTKTDEQEIQSSLKWVGFKQQFFNQTLIADSYFNAGKMAVRVPEDLEKSNILKWTKADLSIPFEHTANFSFPMQMYIGPNDYGILAERDLNLEKMIPLGKSVFRFFNVWLIIPLFKFLNNYIASYGIIILILTILIKLLLFPLTYKTYQSSAKMNLLKDDIKLINEKHEKDKQKAQMETMKLYRSAGVNPAGGCLPTMLQMPILFAMYRFFPASIELRQQSFLWADDLSTYDSIMQLPFNIPIYGDHVSLFTLLMTLSSFLYMRVNSQMTPATNEAMAAQMKIMQNFMPIMFLGIFNKLAAALTFYFFLSNMFTYLQQWVIKKFFIDEEKLKVKIAQNKTKKVKKSKFQKRLEDLQKQSAEIQKQRNKKKK